MKTITGWLSEKVCHRMLYTDELIYSLEDGKFKGVYSDRIAFANLLEGNDSFSLDMFISTDEKVYESSKQNKPCLDYSGMSLFRYEIAERKSTGELTGTFRIISGSGRINHATATASGIFNIRHSTNELSWNESQLLYRDQAGTDGFRPVAFDAGCRFYFEDSKLRFAYNGACYGYNTVTAERHTSTDIIPAFIAKEP